MAKHSTPRRRSGKHWVGTLLTAGAVVACMGLLLRFLPVGTIPTGGDEPSDSAVSSTEPAASSVPEPEPEPVVETLRFSATGDDLIHSPIYKQAARRAANGQQYDFDYCYAQVAPFYAQQDINWINQETLCSDELEPSSYPCFSTPGDCARALYRATIQFVLEPDSLRKRVRVRFLFIGSSAEGLHRALNEQRQGITMTVVSCLLL